MGVAVRVAPPSPPAMSSTTTGSIANYTANHVGSLCIRCNNMHLYCLRIRQSSAGRYQQAKSWSIQEPITVVLFCIGLSSDRLWLITLFGAALCAICSFANKGSASNRAKRLVAAVALLLVAVGSLTTDYVDGGLFDHAPAARCVDGTYSYSGHHQGTCSWHRGVAVWNPKVPWWWRV